MNDQAALTHHPAPHRHKVAWLESAFGLWGGPGAWFLQLCAGFALSSSPSCGYAAAGAVAELLSLAALILAIAALVGSGRILMRTRDEGPGGHSHLLEAGAGRTRFLGMWGLVLGAAFAVATIFSVPAYLILPRCAG
ncbi:MAG TPA: hypothetical protein VGM84_14055 [Steroidobacteraceae bacterium]|jgi:hypothetical protein